MRERFSHQRLREGIYNSSQMDTKWTDEIVADFEEWLKTHSFEDEIDWDKDKDQSDEGGTLLG
jgi:hypothetical protein